MIILPLDNSLHITFGDANNPEVLSPLEAVWRLERLKYGYEVVMGIGSEHSAGRLKIQKIENRVLSESYKDSTNCINAIPNNTNPAPSKAMKRKMELLKSW